MAAGLLLTESDLAAITEALQCSIEAWREWGGEFCRTGLLEGVPRCYAAQRIKHIRGLLRQLYRVEPAPPSRDC
jgi:hypothetical protein